MLGIVSLLASSQGAAAAFPDSGERDGNPTSTAALKPTVLAILPLETSGSTASVVGVLLMNAIENELSDVEGISLVERHRISDVLSEMHLGQTGALDERTVVKVGKLLGANTMGFGSFLNLANENLLTFRLVDVSSGKILCGTIQRGGEATDPTRLAAPAVRKVLKSGCLLKRR